MYYAHNRPVRSLRHRLPRHRKWTRNQSEYQDSDLLSRRLAAIVDNSDDAIVGKDLNGIITSWNKGAERIFGYSAEEMIGTSIMRLIPLERQAEEEEILTRIKRDRKSTRLNSSHLGISYA